MRNILTKPCSLLLFLILVFQPISVVAQSNTDPVESSQPQTTPDYGEPPYWTQWNPEHYSLADGGDAVWLGGVGQVIRWEKNTEQYHRIQIPDSPITQKILAAVVDSAGNRWFGSESGLYRYDLNNQWTHFTNENSGLQSNFVNGLVAGADGIIWGHSRWSYFSAQWGWKLALVSRQHCCSDTGLHGRFAHTKLQSVVVGRWQRSLDGSVCLQRQQMAKSSADWRGILIKQHRGRQKPSYLGVMFSRL